MSTTLPLFWNLSSANKKERIDASVKLIGALEHFQAQFTPKPTTTPEPTSEDENEDEREKGKMTKMSDLDALNAADVAYSIRRLVRGLASPRESSRQGFAVALTELLSRIDTVTCSQIVALILDSSKTQSSMTGQEERDVLFARLFGLIAVIQSGLLVRTTPLSTSASSASSASSPAGYKEVITQLQALGDKKSWLRESAWWTISLAVDALHNSDVPWKEEAFESTIQCLFVDNKIWTPEKVALTLKLQKYLPFHDWNMSMSGTFKHSHVLSTGNYSALARILKDSGMGEDDDADASVMKTKNGLWKPQVHFVWDILLDELLSAEQRDGAAKGSFPEFFRMLVDESLFSSTASPERKYWGFQIFQKALPRVQADDMPMLFTKNFMRSWINHLSNSDRYLHKAAKQVADHIQSVVKDNSTLGFTLIVQLTGVHGSHQFDKLTKTKTVESILASMNHEGILSYIEYLLRQINDPQGSRETDMQALNARRAWIIEQLAVLIRNGAIPKDDEWVRTILDWFVTHGLFSIKKKSQTSGFLALHEVPNPVFSDDLRKACRTKLLSCLADLTAQTTLVTVGEKTSKITAVASDGQFWVSKALSTIEQLNQDAKHVSPLSDVDEHDKALRQNARDLMERSTAVSGEQREAARGVELLLAASVLHQYCIDDEGDNVETLQNCVNAASRMFPAESKKSSKCRKSSGNAEGALEPVDVLVDTAIGFLEQATAYMRVIANQVFSLLSGCVRESTMELILAQLERRDPAELMDEGDENEEMEDSQEDAEGSEDESESSDDGVAEDDDEDLDDAEDAELRKKIENALRVNGIQAATGDSDSESEELMDDEQMMAIDEQLAAVFKARADEKKFGKGVDTQREATHFKNRVLDLLEGYVKKQPTNPLVLRLILPLVEQVTSSGSDERQLTDKTTGILRSRFGKAKEVPSNTDTEQAVEILRELHSHARKAISSDVLSTLSQCSLYVVKCLLHSASEAPVIEAYQESLKDFVTRKPSRLNTNFFQDFIRRYPSIAWALRLNLVNVCNDAVNTYRQTQVFVLLQTLSTQLHTYSDRADEIYSFVTALRPCVQGAVRDACDGEGLTAAQLKEIMKTAQLAVRQSRHVLSPERLRDAWDASSWEALSQVLASSERFRSSTALQTMCKQIIKLLDQPSESAKPAKRKAETVGPEAEDHPQSPAKRRKKTKKSGAAPS